MNVLFAFLPARPRLQFVAIALMWIQFLVNTIWSLANDLSSSSIASVAVSGMIVSWFTNQFVDGFSWARMLYLVTSVPLYIGMVVYAQPDPVAWSPWMFVPFLNAIVIGILLLPSVSDWFRRSSSA